MPSAGLVRTVCTLALKDWHEHRQPVFLLTAGPLLAVLATRGLSADFAKGITFGIALGAAFAFAQYCFVQERTRGTLGFLLSLPLSPRDLILGKYLSLFSMILAPLNLSAVFAFPPDELFVTNALALFLATLTMGCSVVSEKPWAPQIPFYITIFLLPMARFVRRYFPEGLVYLQFIVSNRVLLASLALLMIPVLIGITAAVFTTKTQR